MITYYFVSRLMLLGIFILILIANWAGDLRRNNLNGIDTWPYIDWEIVTGIIIFILFPLCIEAMLIIALFSLFIALLDSLNALD